MGLFDSVAGTFFNAATAAYKTVVAPVQTAVQTITRPVVQGSYQTGATEQVAVQPRPPIVTSVANQNTQQAQQAMVGPQATYTPQTTPSGQQVYVSSRPSPNTPKTIEVTRPVQVQAPSIAESIGMLAPGAGIVGAAQLISGDRRVVQNVISDLPGTGTFVTGAPTLAGYRETNIRQQEAIAQARIEQQNRKVEQIKINNAAQTLRNEQAILGYNQREQALRREVSEFNALGPATSIEEYNTRLNTSNLLNTKIQGLQTEGSKINADILAGKQNLYKQQIGLLNEQDAINRDLVNLNVASANLGTTGIGGLSAGLGKLQEPIAEPILGAVGSPFGLSSKEVRQALAINRQIAEAQVNVGMPGSIERAYGAGVLEDTLTKPGEAALWIGIGVATGGVTRALAPGMEAAVAASRVPGAALGTRALGTGIRAAPYIMGGMFAGQVGFETGFESTPTGLKVRSPGGMVSRLGGLTATEIAPMIGGGIIGYNAPEIGQAAYRGIRAGELRFRRFGESLGEEGLLGPTRGRGVGSGKVKEIEIKTKKETLLDKEAITQIRGLTDVNEEALFIGPGGKPVKATFGERTPEILEYKLEVPKGTKRSDIIDIHTHTKGGMTFSSTDIEDLIGSNVRVAVLKTKTGELHVLERPANVDYTEKMLSAYESREMPYFIERIEDKIFGTSFTRERALTKAAKETGISFRKFSPETETIESAFGIDIPIGKSTTGPKTIDISPGFDYLNEPRGRLTAKPGARSASEIDKLINIDIYAKAPEPEEIINTVARAAKISEKATIDWGMEPAVDLKPEQLLPIPIDRTVSFPTGRGGTPTARIGDIRLPPTPAYEVVEGRGIFRGLVAPEGETIELVKVFEKTPQGIGKTIVSTQMRYPKTIETIDLGMEGGMITRGPKGHPIIDIRSDPFMNPRTGEVWLRGFGTEKSLKLIDANAKSPFIEKTPSLEGRINNAVKDISLGVSRRTEHLKTHSTYKDWKQGMQIALGVEGEEPIIPTLGKEPGFVKAPKATAGQATVGIGISGTALDRASAINLGVSGLGLLGGPVKEMGALVGKPGPDAYQLFLRQIDYEKFYGIGVIPTTIIGSGTSATGRGGRGNYPNIGLNRIPSEEMFDFPEMNIDTSQRRVGPINIGVRGLLPVDIVGEANIPETAFRVTPIQLIGPELLLTPDVRIIQTPRPDLTTRLITDQILITTQEIPPYTPPSYNFEIPPIPPIIIPGFPMGGGGGGGGGFGGDRGGYQFEETLKGGGESDPFGIGGMNFDVMGMMGIPKGTVGKGRRRRRK